MLVNSSELSRKWEFGLFILIQFAVMFLAISNESLWIDEFWNAYFASVGSARELYQLLMIPSGSQTPLDFAYNYFWGLFFQPSELGLRLSNLPLFVAGQLSLFLALRDYPKRFSYLLLALCALHPMVWQYANEVRPYIMLYTGSQMTLAYILYIHAIKKNGGQANLFFTSILVLGSILLFGASMLGVFWVLSACIYIAYFHYQHLNWRYLIQGKFIVLICIFFISTSLLTLYYLNSLLQGGGASKLSTTSVTTLLFDAYELLGLSGIGPGRIALRDNGIDSLSHYWIWLLPATFIIWATLANGCQEAIRLLGSRGRILFVGVLGLMPLVIIIFSGFAMHWRVLGRHMIAEIPILNLLFAFGLAKFFEKNRNNGAIFKSVIGVIFFLVMVISSCLLRFSDRHRKDDYQTVTAIAKQEILKGHRVWWAANALGAKYYGLPGEFDFMGELTGRTKPYECIDQVGVQSVSKASGECLETLHAPDVVILSKPETFDRKGVITAYLKSRNYEKIRELPAFTVWNISLSKNTH